MTLATDANTISFIGSGTTDPMTFPYRIDSADELFVLLWEDDGTFTTRNAGVDYTIAIDTENFAYATVTPLVGFATLADGKEIELRRTLPFTQALDLVTNQRLDAQNIEKQLDRNVMMAQQLSTRTGALEAFSGAITDAVNAAAASAAAAQDAADTIIDNATEEASAAVAAATANAIAAAAAAAASYDSFDDRYLGSKAADPALDNDGNALVVGAIYWNSTLNELRVWSGHAWVIPATNPHQSNALTLSVADFGVIGDGEADDYESMLDAVIAANAIGADLIVGPGLNVLIDMSGARASIELNGCRIIGSGRAQQWFDETSVQRGSWFSIKGTSNPPFTLKWNSGINNMSWLWPDQTDPASPIAYPAAVASIGSLSVTSCELCDNVAVNAYVFADLGSISSGYNRITGNRICALYAAFSSGKSLAETFIQNNNVSYYHGFYFYNALGQLAALETRTMGFAAFLKLTGANTDAWVITGNVAFGLQYGIYGTHATVEGYLWATVSVNNFDACRFGVLFEGKFRPAKTILTGNTFNNQANGDASSAHISAALTGAEEFHLVIGPNAFGPSPGGLINFTGASGQFGDLILSGSGLEGPGNFSVGTFNAVLFDSDSADFICSNCVIDCGGVGTTAGVAIVSARNASVNNNIIKRAGLGVGLFGAISGNLTCVGNTVDSVAVALDTSFGTIAGRCLLTPNSFPGLVNVQTGTSYTFVVLNAGQTITFNNAATIAAALPQAINGFGLGFRTRVKNVGSAPVVITPATSTINGAAALTVLPGQSGEIISDGADYIAVGFNAGDWAKVRKTADESKTSNTTLANDATLVFPMLANTKYHFRARIWYDTPTAADLKWRHTGPATPTLVSIKRATIGPGASALGNVALDVAYSSADVVITETSGTGGYIEIEGIVWNGATAGNFAFQWAQNTSSATPTTVRAGSYLEYATA